MKFIDNIKYIWSIHNLRMLSFIIAINLFVIIINFNKEDFKLMIGFLIGEIFTISWMKNLKEGSNEKI